MIRSAIGIIQCCGKRSNKSSADISQALKESLDRFKDKNGDRSLYSEVTMIARYKTSLPTGHRDPFMTISRRVQPLGIRFRTGDIRTAVFFARADLDTNVSSVLEDIRDCIEELDRDDLPL
jgi:hypothetical protein